MLPIRDLSHPAPIDLAALARNQVRKAQEEVPDYIKRMPVKECIAEAKRLAAELSSPGLKGLDWLNKLKSRIADGERVPLRSQQIVEELTRGQASTEI